MPTLEEILTRCSSGEGKPYKNALIDWDSYTGDGEEPPSDLDCMCVQGQMLHLLAGWTPRQLHETSQLHADRATAKLLNISVAHTILLRRINDSIDGAPAIVLTHPEKVIGDQAQTVLAFWRHLDQLSAEQWYAARATAWDIATVTDRDTAKDVISAAAWYNSWMAVRTAATTTLWYTAREAVWTTAYTLAATAKRATARAAAGATSEIQGAAIMREKEQPFFFLPLFGFNNPSEIVARESNP